MDEIKVAVEIADRMISIQECEEGETGELKEWLDDVIRAKQLRARIDHVAKMCEYKPLAKVEELEEGNYNKIDGLIDNSEKLHKIEDKKQHVRCSIKDKIAEKKEEAERRKQMKENIYFINIGKEEIDICYRL